MSTTLPDRLTAVQIMAAKEEDLIAKLDELGPIAETHQLDCQCETCASFLGIMDELRRRRTK